MNNPGDPYLMTVSWHKIAWMVNRKKLLKIREVCLKLKTHFAADGFLPCIEQHEIITEIPRVARRALVSFLQKLKKMAKKGNAIGCCFNVESLPQLLRVN